MNGLSKIVIKLRHVLGFEQGAANLEISKTKGNDDKFGKHLRIVIITRYFYPYLGGGAIVVRHIFTALAKRGYKIFVITSRLENTPEYETTDGLEIYRPFGGTFFGIKLVPYLMKFLKSHPVDIIFSCDYSGTFAASRAAVKEHLPVITRVGFLFGRVSFRIMNPFSAFFFWLVPGIAIAFGKHSIVCCPSEEVGRRLKRYTRAEVIVIPNPIDTDEISYIRENDVTEDIRVGLGMTNDQQLLLFAGRLSPEKNLDGLLKTLHGLGTDFKLVVVGDGSERARLENMTRKLNLRQEVVFLGQKSHRETLAIMKSCDILILPSKTEVFPSVVLEALALGRPVIATQVGGIAEVKSANLHLVHSLEEIKEILPQIKPEPGGDILEYYSLDKICSRYIAIFNKLV